MPVAVKFSSLITSSLEGTDYADSLVYRIGKEGFLPDFKRPARKMTQSELETQSKEVPGIAVPLPPELLEQ